MKTGSMATDSLGYKITSRSSRRDSSLRVRIPDRYARLVRNATSLRSAFLVSATLHQGCCAPCIAPDPAAALSPDAPPRFSYLPVSQEACLDSCALERSL